MSGKYEGVFFSPKAGALTAQAVEILSRQTSLIDYDACLGILIEGITLALASPEYALAMLRESGMRQEWIDEEIRLSRAWMRGHSVQSVDAAGL